jgi:hypothetical protein
MSDSLSCESLRTAISNCRITGNTEITEIGLITRQRVTALAASRNQALNDRQKDPSVILVGVYLGVL